MGLALARFGLGLLVGLQRERTDSRLAGFRTFPLITMVHAPHTSSRQLHSQATGATARPDVVRPWAAIFCSTLITFMSFSRGMTCFSQ